MAIEREVSCIVSIVGAEFDKALNNGSLTPAGSQEIEQFYLRARARGRKIVHRDGRETTHITWKIKLPWIKVGKWEIEFQFWSWLNSLACWLFWFLMDPTCAVLKKRRDMFRLSNNTTASQVLLELDTFADHRVLGDPDLKRLEIEFGADRTENEIFFLIPSCFEIVERISQGDPVHSNAAYSRKLRQLIKISPIEDGLGCGF